jgi:glycosyltransferase involved in cell wall biosynthesis
MRSGLRIGIGSQTPLLRTLRSLAEMEHDHGPLGSPVELRRLSRGVDYSFTPGGVARMIHALLDQARPSGAWVALANGFPRDIRIEAFLLQHAPLPEPTRAGYGQFKEAMWETLNGLPSGISSPQEAPLLLNDFLEWSRTNAAYLNAVDAEEPFDGFYLNDWQQLPEARLLPPRPKILHYHVPFADWIAAEWQASILEWMRDFDAIVVSTYATASALQDAGLDVPIHVVRPWVSPQDFQRPRLRDVAAFVDRFHIAQDDEVILHVARMDPMKGQDRLLRAFRHVLRRRPRARLVLAGNGSFSSSRKGIGLGKGPRWRARLEALAQELGVDQRVIFTGHIGHRDLEAALARSNVFVFPSVAEGFGLSVVEAMLFEKPVIVSQAAGVSEILDNEVDGIEVDAADPWHMAEAIVDVLSDSSFAEALGRAGRVTALRECDATARVADLLQILESTAPRRRGRALAPPLRASAPSVARGALLDAVSSAPNASDSEAESRFETEPLS